MDLETTLRLQGINQNFGGKNLFAKAVDLTIHRNSATLLYGGSGSGKTSLFNVLTYLTSTTEGKVFWGDKEITSLKEANALRWKFMSVNFSNFSFISELSIKENILVGASLCKIPNQEEKLNELCKTTLNFKDIDSNIDLETLIEKEDIKMLSNGQKEIIAIAATLLIDAKFIISDEMLRSFPDHTKKIVFTKLIEYFSKEKIGFFYVTHWAEADKVLDELPLQYPYRKFEITKDREFIQTKEKTCE